MVKSHLSCRVNALLISVLDDLHLVFLNRGIDDQILPARDTSATRLLLQPSLVSSPSNAMSRVDLVYGQFKHILKHPRQQSLQELTGLLQAWICIYFDEPHIEVFVEDEIVAE